MSKKLHEISLIMDQQLPAVLMLSETFLSKNIPDSYLSIPNYNLIRRDRQTHGGGVATFIHKSFKYTHLASLDDLLPETLTVRIYPDRQASFVLSCIYRPPNSSNSWFQLFENYVVDCRLHCPDHCILGDFNIDLNTIHPKWNSLYTSLGLTQLISQPTRKTLTFYYN